MNQNEKILKFKQMHSKKSPLILFNVWDEVSANIVKEREHVVATSSWAMAHRYGYEDGEKFPFELLIEKIKLISNTNALVSVDIETGYAKKLNELKNNIEILIECGIVGINIEDRVMSGNHLYSIEEQGERINCIKTCSREKGKEIFINARTDAFFLGDVNKNNNDIMILNETIRRAKFYHSQGADGIFIPGLKNKKFIQEICNQSQIPINIMLGYNSDNINDYLNLGVSRISFGPSIYLNIISLIENQMRNIIDL